MMEVLTAMLLDVIDAAVVVVAVGRDEDTMAVPFSRSLFKT